MNKLEQLRQFVAELFSAATDRTIIEKSAVVEEKIKEIEAEETKAAEDYQLLLKDYKDVVIHSAFKPNAVDPDAGAGNPNGQKPFNGDDFINNFTSTHNSDGTEKK